MADRSPSSDDDRTLTFSLGHEELVIRRKYEVASIVNDVMVAAWFVAGSILFFSESTTTAGTWLFLLGSVQLMIRPLLRLARHLHVRRTGGGAPSDDPGDF